MNENEGFEWLRWREAKPPTQKKKRREYKYLSREVKWRSWGMWSQNNMDNKWNDIPKAKVAVKEFRVYHDYFGGRNQKNYVEMLT